MTQYKIVPLTPTPEMVTAFDEAYCPFGDTELSLQIAIQSAPETNLIAVQGWQPIENPPKEESKVLNPNPYLCRFEYIDGGWDYAILYWSSGLGRFGTENYGFANGKAHGIETSSHYVTHWMPLPPLPEGGE